MFQLCLTLIMLISVQLSYERRPLPDTTNEFFLEDCLTAHNAYRRKHSAPELILDQKANNFAKSQVKYFSQHTGLSAVDNNQSRYGENKYHSPADYNIHTCYDAVKLWYNGIKEYNWNNPEFGWDSGSFSQVVWRKSQRLGCARASARTGQLWETYIICNYSPPGNILGQFKANVSPKNETPTNVTDIYYDDDVV